jgi:hypothetical protein
MFFAGFDDVPARPGTVSRIFAFFMVTILIWDQNGLLSVFGIRIWLLWYGVLTIKTLRRPSGPAMSSLSLSGIVLLVDQARLLVYPGWAAGQKE